jgi:hypothetical protein
MMRGQNYQIADLAGINVAHAFHSQAVSSWARATWSTDLSGNVTVLDLQNSDGTTGIPDPWTNTIDSQGNVGIVGTAGASGMLSYGKDLLISTRDWFDGSSMVIKIQ